MNLNQLDDEIIAAVVAGVSKYLESENSRVNYKKNRNTWKQSLMLQNDIRKATLWRSIN